MQIRPKILIVDDKPENLFALEIVLKDLDIELVKAESGNSALKETLHHDFALALLDIQMPGMDGYELAGILREEEKTAHLPFIFISAVYTDNLNVFRGYEKGAFSFITKPFQPEILRNKVKFFIEKYRQEIALFDLNQNLEKKNQELLSINEELESFTYSVSHDLRAPLRAVSGFARILDEDYSGKLDVEGIRLLGSINSNANKMGVLIDDLLAFSRLGRQPLKRTEVDMNQLVKGVMTEINKTTKHKAKVKIDELESVLGDYTLLHQVMVNLISNAIKYSSKKKAPEVLVSTIQKNDETVFCVRDNGAGFNMDYVHKLFGVFQRVHNNDEFEGTGVGLAIVQKIIHKHGGKVWAEGKIDQGAIFYFTIGKQSYHEPGN